MMKMSVRGLFISLSLSLLPDDSTEKINMVSSVETRNGLFDLEVNMKEILCRVWMLQSTNASRRERRV